MVGLKTSSQNKKRKWRSAVHLNMTKGILDLEDWREQSFLS
jgi:hypothetical protein